MRWLAPKLTDYSLGSMHGWVIACFVQPVHVVGTVANVAGLGWEVVGDPLNKVGVIAGKQEANGFKKKKDNRGLLRGLNP